MEDIWSKFYNQPDNYTLEEVMQSKNVFILPGFYNGSVQSYIMNQESGTTKLVWPNGMFNQRVEQYIMEKEKLFLPFPEKTLGVLARGTDFVHTHLHNHPIHALLKEMFDKIDEACMTWENIEYIYAATEDAQNMEAFREKYGSKVYFTDQKRYITSEGQLISDLHRKNNNSSGFQIRKVTICKRMRLFRGNGGLKTATTPVFIHAKWHSVFDLEVECVYQSIQGTPYRVYFVCF